MSRSTFGTLADRGSWLVLALSLALLTLSLIALHAPARSADADMFPVTVVDDEGTEIVIRSRPDRIISLSPANTETVFALGGGPRLVGGTDFDDYPAEAVELADVATFNGVIMERLVDLEPDLVLAAGNFFTPPADIARMRELGYPVVVVYAPDVEGVLADIELIGQAIGESETAAGITSGMRMRIEEIAAAAAAAGSRPRTYYEFDFFEGATFGPAPLSFTTDLIERAGGEAITTGDPQVFQMPLERLIEADPQVIVLGDAMFGVCPDQVAERSGWTGMSAVVQGRVRAIDGLTVTRPGPRLADGLARLALTIHAELDLEDLEPATELCAD